MIFKCTAAGLRDLLRGNGLDAYIDNFERYGFDEESITAVELRDYDVLGIAGEDRQKLFKLIQRCGRPSIPTAFLCLPQS